jgi:putative ABC transport system ATP-binding protein
MMPALPTIAVRDLRFSFGSGALERQVLKGISLSIAQGEVVIMTGPSGSGKTTFLTIVGALRHASTGSVKVLGCELVGATTEQMIAVRRQNGYIFQQHNLIDSLTALQNVCMTLEIASDTSEAERQRKAAQMLEQVGLADYLHQRPGQLSGGQRQRVSIARALVNNPKMVLADEPTASLDKASGQECVHILKRLAEENGTTILLVTHDYRILDLAHRVVELEDGVLTR